MAATIVAHPRSPVTVTTSPDAIEALLTRLNRQRRETLLRDGSTALASDPAEQEARIHAIGQVEAWAHEHGVLAGVWLLELADRHGIDRVRVWLSYASENEAEPRWDAQDCADHAWDERNDR